MARRHHPESTLSSFLGRFTFWRPPLRFERQFLTSSASPFTRPSLGTLLDDFSNTLLVSLRQFRLRMLCFDLFSHPPLGQVRFETFLIFLQGAPARKAVMEELV